MSTTEINQLVAAGQPKSRTNATGPEPGAAAEVTAGQGVMTSTTPNGTVAGNTTVQYAGQTVNSTQAPDAGVDDGLDHPLFG